MLSLLSEYIVNVLKSIEHFLLILRVSSALGPLNRS